MTKYRINPNNPRKQASDMIPIEIRDWSRRTPLSPGSLYNTIIPATKNHGSWILGAKPSFSELVDLQTKLNKSNIHIVRVIAPYEHEEDSPQSTQFAPKIHWLTWHDHGTLNIETGKNETVESMQKFQGININHGLYQDFFGTRESEVNNLYYCHCMAGKSRSFLETMVFIYLCPDKERLFDFDDPAWDVINFGRNNPEDLKKRLRDNPSFTDISEFIKLQRVLVKELANLDGDQAGFVGLMSLSKWAEASELIQERNLKRLCSDASDIGLMLKAPLDRGFRDPFDIEKQEKNLVKVYKAYEERGINLLMAMIDHSDIQIPAEISHEDLKKYLENNFENNFKKLLPSEQAHFAILMRLLETKGHNLKPIDKTSVQLAEIALERADGLTAGDQVELLRTFGNLSKIEDYNSVAKKIVSKIVYGNLYDKYNAGIQLAELYIIAKKKEKDDAVSLVNEGAKLELVAARKKSWWDTITPVTHMIFTKSEASPKPKAFTVNKIIEQITHSDAKNNSLEEDERFNFSIRLSELKDQMRQPSPNDTDQQPTNESSSFEL